MYNKCCELAGLPHEIIEESPSINGQECKLTTCEGDFKDSATEKYRLKFSGKGGKAR